MQTNFDDDQQLRSLIDAGAQPVTFAEIKARAERGPQPARRARARSYRRPAMILTGAVAAAGAAAITIVAVGQPGAGTGTGAVYTTAMIRQVANATRAALATSGKMVFRTVGPSLETVSEGQPGHRTHMYHARSVIRSTESFSGKDTNITYLVRNGAIPGQKASTDFEILRSVHGRIYEFLRGGPACREDPSKGCDPGKPHWYHLTGQGISRLVQADPRGLLAALEPSARFVVAGHQLVDGVRTTELRATRLTGLPHLPAPADIAKGTKPEAFLVWIDSRNVVRRIVLKAREGEHLSGSHTIYPRRLRFTTQIDFRDIGVRQHIVAPAHSFPYPT